MKKFRSLFLILMLFFLGTSVYGADSIDRAISKSGINKDAVSISIKDIKTGKTVYSLHSGKPVSPASTQKLVTLAASLDNLGGDYQFETALYKSTGNDLYFKLGADPYLTGKDLKSLLSAAKAKNVLEPKNIYIDDSVLDSVNWGEGWQWDDDLNPLMPKFGSYNLDRNLIRIIIAPTTMDAPANVYPEVFYPLTFMNLVTTGKKNDVSVSHNTTVAGNILQVEGTVAKLTGITIPVNNIKLYFRLRLEDAVSDSKIEYYGTAAEKKLPDVDVYLIKKVEHPLTDAVKDILQKSNNMMAETVFKLAGGNFTGNTGSIESAQKMFNAFCVKNNLNVESVKIVDGSGVSKNNLMTAEFMTSLLVAQSKLDNFETYKSSMAYPGIGTLSDRMLYFGENLRAKTGTLSDISAIAGYLKTQKGHEYAFDIMISDPKSKSADKKILEEYILRSLYANY